MIEQDEKQEGSNGKCPIEHGYDWRNPFKIGCERYHQVQESIQTVAPVYFSTTEFPVSSFDYNIRESCDVMAWFVSLIDFTGSFTYGTLLCIPLLASVLRNYAPPKSIASGLDDSIMMTITSLCWGLENWKCLSSSRKTNLVMAGNQQKLTGTLSNGNVQRVWDGICLLVSRVLRFTS